MWSKILDVMGGSVLGGIKDIINEFHLSPGDKARLEGAMREQEARLQTAVVAAASENIKAEANAHWYSAAARPTFVYIVNAVVLNNYLIRPYTGSLPVDFPEPLYWLFGSVVLGYVGARTWERTGLSFAKGMKG